MWTAAIGEVRPETDPDLDKGNRTFWRRPTDGLVYVFHSIVWEYCLLGHSFLPSLETGGSLPGRNLKTKGGPGRGITYKVLGNPQGTGKQLKDCLGPKDGSGGCEVFSARNGPR